MYTEPNTMPPCPSWCCEEHGADEERTRSADHFRPLLHEIGGTMVALQRLDTDGHAGVMRVVVDADPHVEQSPARAQRLALALLTAVAVEQARC